MRQAALGMSPFLSADTRSGGTEPLAEAQPRTFGHACVVILTFLPSAAEVVHFGLPGLVNKSVLRRFVHGNWKLSSEVYVERKSQKNSNVKRTIRKSDGAHSIK